jgi:cation diffusion facilitator family transporter
VAATIQAFLIIASALYIAFRALSRLLDPPEGIDAELGLVVMLITAGVNLVVARYVSDVGRRTASPAIRSDARHLWTNVVQAVAIVGGLALVQLTGEIAFDAITALGLAAYLVWVAANILWTSLHEVLDSSLSEEDLKVIERAIMNQSDKIAGFHRLRTRRSGQCPYIEVHVIQPSDMTVAEADAVADLIEAEIHQRWPEAVITIQTEPADGRFLGPMQSPDSRGLEGERRVSRP